MGCTANLIGLLLMSVDHFIVVRFSLRHRILMRKRVVFSLLGGSWVVSAIMGFLSAILIASKRTSLLETFRKSYPEREIDYCWLETFYVFKTSKNSYYVQVGQEVDTKIILGAELIIMSLSFIMMIFTYIYIACTVVRVSKEQQQRLKSCRMFPKHRDSRMRKARYKGVCTTVLLLGTFVLVWLPTETLYILDLLKSELLESSNLMLIRRILLVIVSSTGLIDVGIYFLRSREFIAVMELKNECFRLKPADSSKSSSNTPTSKDTAQVNV